MQTPKQKLIQKLQEFVGKDMPRVIKMNGGREMANSASFGYNQALAQLRDKIPNLVDEVIEVVVGQVNKIKKSIQEKEGKDIDSWTETGKVAYFYVDKLLSALTQDITNDNK